jgi:hypothetical protein
MNKSELPQQKWMELDRHSGSLSIRYPWEHKEKRVSKKSQIDQIEEMIGQDHVVHWELKRGERANIERFISISCYRGIRHQDGSPLRGQRTHTNARTCRKLIRKLKKSTESPWYLSDQSH